MFIVMHPDPADQEGAVLYAQVGDRLILEGDPARTGIIIGLAHEDGSPPYVVKWQSSGHIAMVSPGPYARVIPAGHPAGSALPQPSSGR
jgi:hypothetical protein